MKTILLILLSFMNLTFLLNVFNVNAGEIHSSEKTKQIINIKEKSIPKIFEELKNTEYSYEAEYNDIEDLKELLNLSDKNSQVSNFNKWDKVLPLYTTSPIN